jgi:apolipoprotein N-acyltransferase
LVQSSQEIYGRLTREAAKDRPGLVVWPEAAIPTYLDYDRTTEKWLSSYADSLGVPILTGAFDFDTNDRRLYYNAAYCIGPGIKGIPRYHKIRLVPFSERIPWVADIPFCYRLSKKYFLDLGDFTPGDTCKVFDVADRKSKFRFSSPICFDSVFPNLVSRFVLNGARFLVIITNDGWFGRTSGPYQHARIAVLRAIENRVWIARCANTGVSEFIDPQGRVAASTPIYREAVLTREIGLSAEQAWFTVHGAVVPRFFGLIALGSTALTGSRQLRSRQRSR